MKERLIGLLAGVAAFLVIFLFVDGAIRAFGQPRDIRRRLDALEAESLRAHRRLRLIESMHGIGPAPGTEDDAAMPRLEHPPVPR